MHFIQYYCHMFTSFHSIPGLYSSFIWLFSTIS
jgi:hypothetical protein